MDQGRGAEGSRKERYRRGEILFEIRPGGRCESDNCREQAERTRGDREGERISPTTDSHADAFTPFFWLAYKDERTTMTSGA
jgi:hypothetical protein